MDATEERGECGGWVYLQDKRRDCEVRNREGHDTDGAGERGGGVAST